MTPYQNGYRAYWVDVPYSNNPYTKNTPDWTNWAKGWIAARNKDANLLG
jgi:hypothetical protein